MEDFQFLREEARNVIIEALDTVSGEKVLAADPQLLSALSLLVEFQVLETHGVQKIYVLEEEHLDCKQKDIIYILRPRIEMMQALSFQIKDHEMNNMEKRYYLFLWPRVTKVCEKVLENQGVLGKINIINELKIDLVPLENDLLSLLNDQSLRCMLLDRDHSVGWYAARAIFKLQQTLGPIPIRHAKGFSALECLTALQNMEKEEELDAVPVFDQLVIIDREMDLVSPLCTQFTYEGLLDEQFGIQNSVIKVNPQILEKEGTRPINISLTNTDTVYAEIRDLNFCVLKTLLQQKLVYIQETFDEKDKLSQSSISEMRQYVTKVKNVNKEKASVENHLHLALHCIRAIKDFFFAKDLRVEQALIMGEGEIEAIEYLDKLIARQEPIEKVLRLLCLISLTCNGIKAKFWDGIRMHLLQSYGYQHLITFSNLEQAGLLKKQEGKNVWNTTKTQLKLLYAEVNQSNPDDISYAYAGYAPLSLRLVEQLLFKGGWTECLKQFPAASGIYKNATRPEKPLILLFFLGGMTSAEMAGVRWLNTHTEKQFVAATTHMINWKTFLESFTVQGKPNK